MDTEQRLLAQLRDRATTLPEVTETTTFGHPTFRAGKKSFAIIEHYKSKLAFYFKVTPDLQDTL
jgi:hypothetical protein